MATLQDLVTPRPLNRVELWLAWGTKMIPYHETKRYEECILPNAAMTSPLAKTVLYPAVRVTYYPTPPAELVIAHSCRAALLALVAEAFIFLPSGAGADDCKTTSTSICKIREDRCQLFLKEYVWNRFEIPTLQDKLAKDEEIFCTIGNWLEALHGYAKAWATLLPYHREALAKEDPARQALIDLENVIFVNIMAAVVTGLKDANANLSENDKKELCEIGLRAAAIPLNRWEAMTVGLMRKTCTRLLTIQTILAHVAPSHPAKLDTRFIKSLNQVIKNLTAEPIEHRTSRVISSSSGQGATLSRSVPILDNAKPQHPSKTRPKPAAAATAATPALKLVPEGWDDSKVHPNDIKPIAGLWALIAGNMLEARGQEHGRKWTLGLSDSSRLQVAKEDVEVPHEDID